MINYKYLLKSYISLSLKVLFKLKNAKQFMLNSKISKLKDHKM